MTLDEAQDIAFQWANLNNLSITLAEIKQALVVLGNFYEDTKRYDARTEYYKKGVQDAINIIKKERAKEWKLGIDYEVPPGIYTDLISDIRKLKDCISYE